MRRWCCVVVAIAVLAGCGDDSSGTSDDDVVRETVTVEKTVAEQPKESTPEEASPEEPSEDAGSGDITVPNVVGKDHQLAQDTMQAAGLYNLVEEDATGQDRMLLWDRNWTVVGQDPPGGTTVS